MRYAALACEMLRSANAQQLASTRCQQAAVWSEEFTKLVYESKFTKPAKGMSFVNASLPRFRPVNVWAQLLTKANLSGF